MKIHMLAAIALGLGMSTAAFAENPGKGMPETWKGAIGDTFYSDSTAMTLRSQDDVKTRWSSLSAEQQAQVRADCKNLAMNTDTDTTASTSVKPKTGAESERTGGGQMVTLCGWVDSM
jgi:hypothetical protein